MNFVNRRINIGESGSWGRTRLALILRVFNRLRALDRRGLKVNLF